MLKRTIQSVSVLLAVCSSTSRLEADSPASIVGRWYLVSSAEGQKKDYYLDLFRQGDQLTGILVSPRSFPRPLRSCTFDGDTFVCSVRANFGQIVDFTVRGKVTRPGKIEGELLMGDDKLGSSVLTRIGNPVGVWEVSAKSGDAGTFTSRLELKRAKTALSGVSVFGEITSDLKRVRWIRDKLQLEYELLVGEKTRKAVAYVGFKDENTLDGQWATKDGKISGPWTARRRHAPFQLEGTWKVTASTEAGAVQSVVVFSVSSGTYKGKYSSELGETEYKSVHLEGGELKLAIALRIDGESRPFVVKAALKDVNTFEGRWRPTDSEEGGGRWVARREVADGKPKEQKKKAEKKDAANDESGDR